MNNFHIVKLELFLFRYILNIIISYELFLEGKKETAIKVMILIGKWLEELDNCIDAYYFSISNGLKYVLTSMYIHMNLNKNHHTVSLFNTTIIMIHTILTLWKCVLSSLVLFKNWKF